jgi:uncharacterized iron-regulated membrane protein
VNLTQMPPGYYVGCSLPDGRVAIADAENPDHAAAVAAIRARDYPAVAAWMDGIEPLPDGHLFVWQETQAA